MAEDKELIRKRASYKGQLTNFNSFVSTLESSSATEAQANQLQLRIGKLESLYQQYDEVQLRLECITEDISSQIAERSEFEALYYSSLSHAQLMLSSMNKKREDFASCSDRSSQNRKLVKLPTINLPKYSGSYDNWLEFHDTFTSLIHSNDEIDNINKFHYLRASLEGSAAVVIKSLEFSASNYNEAWTLLCERFNNKRLLLQNHVSALFNIEPITRESSAQLKRVIDQVNKTLRSLKSLNEPVEHWGTLLIHIISHKLDSKTFREWETHKGTFDKNTTTSFDSFLSFMRNRADLIETLELSSAPAAGHVSQTTHKPTHQKHRTMIVAQENKSKPCPKCNGDHNLSNCSLFLALSNVERLQSLPVYKVCYNCFRTGHYANRCKKAGCKTCKRKHNSLIHIAEPHRKADHNEFTSARSADRATTGVAPAPPPAPPGTRSVTLSARAGAPAASPSPQQEVLLSTALIKLYDANNCEHIARAILDSGSTSCIMTEKMCKVLKLNTDRVDKSIIGINNIASHVGKLCRVSMKSLNENYTATLNCFVLPSITDDVPSQQLDLSSLCIPDDLCLADPHFQTPAAVDIIIGADLFWDLLGSQKIRLGEGQPILYETRLGWLVSGPINSHYESVLSRNIKCNFTTVLNAKCNESLNDNVQSLLPRFWQLEEVQTQSSDYSSEEKLCEEHFTFNTSRLQNGRFCVRLPLKEDPNVLGNSITRAKHCFLSLERRIARQPEYKQLYKDFMAEYQSLGHMTECERLDPNSNYIPHHGVMRDSTTTKLRVVYNASSLSSSGRSLNEIQMVGPTVQDDLLSILLRFRQHKYVISADVEKMYRQIAVHPDDRYLQQIIWRDDPSDRLRAFTLNVVTYGTASAPYLATRCLKQIGLECDDHAIREIIIHDFYVDDLLTGGDDFNEVLFIREQVTSALSSACMNLRKWKSNDPRLLPNSHHESLNLNMGITEPCKTLGLGWQPSSDELWFKVGKLSPGTTKRDVLSVIAQIFDPLGLLSPCVILMKMLLQRLWLCKMAWDEQLSPEILSRWANILQGLPALNTLRIPRHVMCDSYQEVNCHIFCDASERAYGACVYLRSTNMNGEVKVSLLFAKSRVAPIRPTTIPRLELCGALVAARLYEKAMSSLRIKINSTTFWTDSTIVLGWLKMLPNKLQPFVRNRTAEILEKTANCTWRHVPTDQNPADHISRGVGADLLPTLAIWWLGPTFLQLDKSNWPPNPTLSHSLPETKPEISLHVAIRDERDDVFINFNRFSNFSRLKRAVAYVIRFINACKRQPLPSYLTDTELRDATTVLVRLSQQDSFPEYQLLLAGKSLPKKNHLLKFNVFLDDQKLLRVGGRLVNSEFPYEKKHPALINSTHRFTQLLFHHEHKKLMHAGPKLLLTSIKDNYWPIGGNNLAKHCFQQCVLCTRFKGQIVKPIMGNLPKHRLSPSFVFDNVGVDYAGPLNAASRQGRGSRLVKVYIAIFICFTTKAIHLELVGDLTSNCFLSALRRFVSRRGKPSNIYSDNGTSFVGACNDLSKFLKSNCSSLAEGAANEEINFHFIPAYSPHFGGLWEAGVKSCKYHLQRVLGHCHLNYEEFITVLAQIEAILNSRPLTPLSTNPEDLMPLSPGHFLIGRPLQSLPGPSDLIDKSYSHLTRYQRIEQLRQHFWTRWSKEYVSELQVRSKWRNSEGCLKMNSLVLLKEDQLPPMKWRLGRIVAIHPGSDGISRVADVKTTGGTVRRSFSRICPLPESSNVG